MSIFKDKVVKLLGEKTNPYLMGRIGMNAAMNSSTIKWKDNFLIVAHVEGSRSLIVYLKILYTISYLNLVCYDET